ncbi:MAG: RCC1 domain-containing protein, partial [Dehalococcoidia bacterium]
MSRRKWVGAAALLAVALVVAASSPRLLHGVQAAASRTAVTAVATPATPMVAVGGRHTCALNSSGAVRCWGANDNGQLGDGTTISHQRPALVAGLSSGVTAIAAGSAHTCALTTAGGVKCWGSNANGELGDFTQVNRS